MSTVVSDSNEWPACLISLSLPVALCASRAIFTPLSRYSTTLTKSASLKLREVRAGAPAKQRTVSDQHLISPYNINTEEMRIE